MELTTVKSVGIIGAGVSGLLTAKTLMAQGLDCTLFERGDRLGGVWADGYLNFGVQVQKELYEFPDWPLPADTPSFTPGPIFQKYLEDYSDHFGIRPQIRFETTVESLEPRGDGRDGWTLVLSDGGGTQRADFDLVVVCVGLYSNRPNKPAFPGQDAFRGEILHISGLRSRDQLKDKRVAVLGYGKSATDAALEAAAVARETHIVFREPHWPVPRKLAGILPFKWGMLNRLTSSLIPPYQHPSRLERALHGPGKPLVWLWWRIVEILLYVQHGLGRRIDPGKSLVPGKPVDVDSFGESTMVPRPELYRAIRRSRITAHRSEIAGYTEGGVTLKSGRQIDVDLVVLGTGWQTDYGFLSEPVLDALAAEEDGFYLYRHMLHPDAPNLAFVGRASTICSILTYSLQARWLADIIAGKHALPPRIVMRQEIEDMKTWKRAWMPFSSARGARLILHMLHYHDELLRDFGANPLRKTGIWAPLKELIEPYQPSDYRTIVSGEWEGLEGRSLKRST